MRSHSPAQDGNHSKRATNAAATDSLMRDDPSRRLQVRMPVSCGSTMVGSNSAARGPCFMKVFVYPFVAALMLLAAPAWADLSRDDAAAAAQRVSGGRILSVEKTESARRPVWRVKVVTAQGEVRVILIDAVSGQAL
jgi:uncharacterized membrane protein YkoI